VLALIDETVPSFGSSLAYCLAGCIFLGQLEDIENRVRLLTKDRLREFHWHREGPVMREAIRELIRGQEIMSWGLVSVCGRRGQSRARARCLQSLLRLLVEGGVESIVIEKRTATQDVHDMRVVKETLAQLGASHVRVSWEGKTCRALCLPDAVAGALADHLLDRDPLGISRGLLSDVGLTEPIWLPQ